MGNERHDRRPEDPGGRTPSAAVLVRGAIPARAVASRLVVAAKGMTLTDVDVRTPAGGTDSSVRLPDAIFDVCRPTCPLIHPERLVVVVVCK